MFVIAVLVSSSFVWAISRAFSLNDSMVPAGSPGGVKTETQFPLASRTCPAGHASASVAAAMGTQTPAAFRICPTPHSSTCAPTASGTHTPFSKCSFGPHWVTPVSSPSPLTLRMPFTHSYLLSAADFPKPPMPSARNKSAASSPRNPGTLPSPMGFKPNWTRASSLPNSSNIFKYSSACCCGVF